MLIRHRQRGFSLIELMIGLTLVAMLLTFGMPSFTVWLQNTRIRSAAEALQSGLQLARAEAVRRNTSTVFTLTNSAPITANVNSVTPSSTGNNWFLRVFQSGGAYSSADFVQAAPVAGSGALVTLQRANGGGYSAVDSLIFDGLGQVAAVSNGGALVTSHTEIKADISSANGACQHAATPGEMRCLQLTVMRGGQVRMCDPKVIDSADSRKC